MWFIYVLCALLRDNTIYYEKPEVISFVDIHDITLRTKVKFKCILIVVMKWKYQEESSGNQLHIYHFSIIQLRKPCL